MRLRRLLKKLGLSLLTLVVLLVLAEGIARLAEPGPFTFFDRRPFVEDDELVWHHRPGFRGRWEDSWYEIDSRGLRGPELPSPEAPGYFRVVALGDSCTFGKGVHEGETWPRVLERLLDQDLPDGLRASVANLGAVGYASHQYLASFRRFGAPFRPSIVVVGYNLNDFPNSAAQVDQQVFHERGLRRVIPVWLRDALSRTALYRRARSSYYELVLEDDWERVESIAAGLVESAADVRALAREAERLGQLVAEARALGAEVLVLLFPYESQVYVESYDPSPIAGFATACAELGVPFVDLAQVFRDHDREGARGLFLSGDRYHPSAAGYQVVAKTVHARLRAEGWLPIGAR